MNFQNYIKKVLLVTFIFIKSKVLFKSFRKVIGADTPGQKQFSNKNTIFLMNHVNDLKNVQ